MNSTNRGFSLLEAMVALALSGLLAGTVSATFTGSIAQQSKSKHDWEAFTIAQQYMERWSSMPRSSALLDENVAAAAGTPGAAADADCSGVPAGERHRRVDGYGVAKANGVYDVCVKVSDGSPEGILKNVRVVVSWVSSAGATQNVLLQTFR